MFHFLKSWIAPFFIFLFYRVLSWTWRVRYTESPSVQLKLKDNKPFVIAHWHGQILGMLYLLKKYHCIAIVSQSKDGELIAKVIKLFGFQTARGSSTRGGVGAIKSMLKITKQGGRPTIAVDGPKGPRGIPKPGIFEISKLMQLPIYPLVCKIHSGKTFERAWDLSILPYPFSRIDVCLGDEWGTVPKSKDTDFDALSKSLANHLEKTSDQFN